MDTSERHPQSRDGGTPAERLLALLGDGPRDRGELAALLRLGQRQVADVIDQLGAEIVSANGRVSLATPASERQPRRGRSPEHLRLRAERRVADADTRTEVAKVRERLLGAALLARESVPAWLEHRARSGEPVEHVTTSGDAVVRQERPQIEYAGPGDTAARSVTSTSELEPLRQLSERLASHYGWQPAQATIYVLTGAVPISGVRIATRQTWPDPGAPTRWTAEFDADEDPEVVARAIRRAQRERGIGRRAKVTDAKRLTRLAPFVAQHGTGESARERWNRENRDRPSDQYGSRQSFHRAVGRATRAA